MELYTVEWMPNPLESKIILTELGRMRLRFGVAMDAITDVQACLSLAKEQQDFKWCDKYDFYGENVDTYVEEQAVKCEQWLIEEHCGDCTCVPAPCIRCYAEARLGFSTTETLGKHEGHNVQTAFRKGRTLDEAIAYLKGPITAAWGTPKDWEAHMERWTKERNNAVEWLTKYKQEHFSNEQ